MLFGLIPAVILLRKCPSSENTIVTARPLVHVWRATTGLGAMGLFFFSLSLLPLADAVALSFTKTFFLVILAVPLLGERLSHSRLIATALGLIGVLVVLQPMGNYTDWVGPCLALGSALCFALSMITVKKLSTTDGTATIVLYYTSITALVSGISLYWSWEKPTLFALFLFVGLGAVGGTGQLLMTSAFLRAPAVVVAPFTYSAIIWAVLFGFIFWGEYPQPYS